MADSQRPAGQPFTFSGIARYATAGWPRVFGVGLLFALLPGLVVCILAFRCWAPVITDAVAALPEILRIENGALQSDTTAPRLLSANHFLAVQLVLGEMAAESAAVDIEINLGRFDLGIMSLLGETALAYPAHSSIRLDRSELMPFWGAWKAPLIFGLSLAALPSLIAIWLMLGAVYAPLACLIGSLARKELGFGSAWKMCVAAQWPASLLMTFALALYATGEIGLLFVVIMFFAHFLPSILNVMIAPLFLPRVEKTKAEEGQNPFNTTKKGPKSRKNPFRTAEEEETT